MVHYGGMSRDTPQFKLRVPPELKEKISEAAAANHRSINAEVLARLEQSFSMMQTLQSTETTILLLAETTEKLKTTLDNFERKVTELE